jgi:hypothetical protein
MTLLTLPFRLLSALHLSFQSAREAEDAYLDGAVDIYDLERRMKQIETRDTQQPFHLRHSA